MSLLLGKLLQSGGKRRQYWKKSPVERFCNKVSIGDECWEWLAGKRHGYGAFYVSGKYPDVVQVPAHRYLYELFVGARPNHLFLGTVEDNNRDMLLKGRQVAPHLNGETNPACKLKKAEEIMSLYSTGAWSTRNLAKKFDVSATTIRLILRGKWWKEVTGGLQIKRGHMGKKLLPEEVMEIRRLCDEGIFQRIISERFKISQTTVSNILLRKTWHEI